MTKPTENIDHSDIPKKDKELLDLLADIFTQHILKEAAMEDRVKYGSNNQEPEELPELTELDRAGEGLFSLLDRESIPKERRTAKGRYDKALKALKIKVSYLNSLQEK